MIERIFISPTAGQAQTDCAEVEAVAGCGIAGDRYFSHNTGSGQSITLVEAAVIEAFVDEFGRTADWSITRRNLVTRGVRLNDLVGRTFHVGEAMLFGIELCEPCSSLGKALAGPELAPAEVVRWFLHRGGLRADILVSGIIRVGDTLAAQPNPATV